MSAPSDTTWPIEPHTEAKHRILREWWNGWLPIIAQTPRNTRVIYFEGFAGPGVYADGEPGSPIVALQAALGHTLRRNFERKDIRFLFTEERADRAARLEQEVARIRPQMPASWHARVVQGDFVSTMGRILAELERDGSQLAPTFAFLDPFGFGDLPMDLVSRILAYRHCDLLITFDVRDINRFADNPEHNDAIARCLGTTGWHNALPSSPEERRAHFLGIYESELQGRVRDARLRSFQVAGMHGPIYYLVGATKHREGVRVMKRAMWTEDPTGRYQFSDRTAGQNTLIEWADTPIWIEHAAGEVYARFAGRRARLQEVEDFVLDRTIYQFQKGILKTLEEQGQITNVASSRARRRGSFPDDCEIVFR